MKIYVGNLPFSVDDDGLKQIFEVHGEVESSQVITDRESGRSRGFGFVEMNNEDAANKAIEALSNSEVGGRKLTVNQARPKERNRQRSGGRW
jgi:RNA recognition motif-containing protein